MTVNKKIYACTCPPNNRVTKKVTCSFISYVKVNVALHKDIIFDGIRKSNTNATDGDSKSCCEKTPRSASPRVTIDLGRHYLIKSVEMSQKFGITGSKSSMKITVSNSTHPLRGKRCFEDSGRFKDKHSGDCLEPICGRYVQVRLSYNRFSIWLQLCELKAYTIFPDGCGDGIGTTVAEADQETTTVVAGTTVGEANLHETTTTAVKCITQFGEELFLGETVHITQDHIRTLCQCTLQDWGIAELVCQPDHQHFCETYDGRLVEPSKTFPYEFGSRIATCMCPDERTLAAVNERQGRVEVNCTTPMDNIRCKLPNGTRVSTNQEFYLKDSSTGVDVLCKCPGELAAESKVTCRSPRNSEKMDQCLFPDVTEVALGQKLTNRNNRWQLVCTCDDTEGANDDEAMESKRLVATPGYADYHLKDQLLQCMLPNGTLVPTASHSNYQEQLIDGRHFVCMCDNHTQVMNCMTEEELLVMHNHTEGCHLEDGRHIPAGLLFRSLHDGERLICSCEMTKNSSIPCSNYIIDDLFCYLGEGGDIPRGRSFESIQNNVTSICMCPALGEDTGEIECHKE